MKTINVGDYYKLKGDKRWEVVMNIKHNTHGIKGDDENYCCINGEYCPYNLIEIKKSSYQKLKEENQKLKQDIYNLVMKEQSFDSIQTREVYRMKFGMADSVMFGSRQAEGPFVFGGFISEMNDGAKKAIKDLIEHQMPPMRNSPEWPKIAYNPD